VTHIFPRRKEKMKKKALFIGGTGTISTAIVKRLVNDLDWEVWVLNRGNRLDVLPDAVKHVVADINNESDVLEKLGEQTFDCICEFIGFTVDQVERDYRLFKGKTKQYIYISSASAYHKPASGYIITEGTSLANPYWEYSRNKIACEEFLMKKYKEEDFPVTIVRPSHTYDERNIPLGVHGNKGPWQVVKRMMEGKPVIIQGDGSSLWTLTWNADFAVGYTGLMGNRHAIGEAFQITSDETLTWDQIYATIADALGVELKAYHVSTDFLRAVGDPLGFDFTGSLLGDKSVSVVFDNTKLKRTVPDMQTKTRFDMGVRIALDYVLSHPECQVEDPDFDSFCDRVIDALEKAKASI
jgi:nucleoside-diphosphate-sugar epimerase